LFMPLGSSGSTDGSLHAHMNMWKQLSKATSCRTLALTKTRSIGEDQVMADATVHHPYLQHHNFLWGSPMSWPCEQQRFVDCYIISLCCDYELQAYVLRLVESWLVESWLEFVVAGGQGWWERQQSWRYWVLGHVGLGVSAPGPMFFRYFYKTNYQYCNFPVLLWLRAVAKTGIHCLFRCYCIDSGGRGFLPSQKPQGSLTSVAHLSTKQKELSG
ncbi:MAG: hypothetical protein ABFQ95_07180, partial [Pseudomonadota bacterium]